MSTNAQAICVHLGHDWMPWGLFHHVQQPMAPVVRTKAGDMVMDTPVTAYRYGQCVRCGQKRRQAWRTNEIEEFSE